MNLPSERSCRVVVPARVADVVSAQLVLAPVTLVGSCSAYVVSMLPTDSFVLASLPGAVVGVAAKMCATSREKVTARVLVAVGQGV